MNTTGLVELIAEETGQTKEQTKATLEAAFKIIRGSVASNEPVLPAEAFRKEVNHRS